jgi:hypothetical protein
MPTLESLIQQLKLSQDPLYQSLNPENAETWARELESLYTDPTNQLVLQNLGIDYNQLLDAPLSAQGISDQRESFKLAQQASDQQHFGLLGDWAAAQMGGVSRGAASVVDQFGLMDMDPIQPSPDEMSIAGVSIPQMGGSILANLALFAPAAGTVGAGLAAAGVGPGLTSIGSFATAGGGLELLRQTGRNIAKGEPMSVANLLAETAIAGAGGVPLSRPMAAMATAGVAGAAGMLGADVDAKRVGAEALFALIFGNPRIADVGLQGVKGEDPVLPAKPDPLKMDPEKLTELDNALGVVGKTARGSQYVNWNQLSRLMMMAEQVDDPTARSIARGRFEATKEVTETHNPAQLTSIMRDETEGPIVQIIAADALAQHTGQTRPVDAPAQPTTFVKKKVKTIWDESDESFVSLFDPTNEEGLRQQLDQARRIQQQVGETRLDPLGDPNQYALTPESQWFSDKIAEITTKVGQQFEHPQKVNERAIQKAATAEHAAEGRPYAQVGDDYMLRLDELDNEIRTLEASGASQPDIRAAKNRQAVMTNELARALAGNHQVETEQIAQGIFELMLKAANSKAEAANMLEGMPSSLRLGEWADWGGRMADKRIKQLMKPHEQRHFQRQLKRNLANMAAYGAEVQDPFRSTVNAIVSAIETSAVSKGKLRQMGGVSGLLEPISEAIPNTFYKNYIQGLTKPQRKNLVKEVNSLLFEPAQLTRTGVSLNRLRKEAFRHGMNIADDMTLSVGHFSTKFNKLSDIAKYIQDIRSGNIVDPIALQSEASVRGATVKHVGENEHVIIDHHEGTVEVASSPQEAAQIIREKPVLSDDAPDLTPGSPVTMSGVVPRQGWNGEDVRLDHIDTLLNTEGTPAKAATIPIIRDTRNARSLSQDIESMTKGHIPAYTQYFLPYQQATEARTVWERPFSSDLQSMRRKVRRSKTGAVQEALASPAMLDDVAAYHKLNSKEKQVVKALQKWYSELLDIDSVKLAKVVQDFRRNAGDPNRAQSAFMLPAELEFARQGIMEGRVRLDNDNFMAVASDLLREKGNWLHLRGLEDQSKKVLNQMHKWSRGRPERSTLYETMMYVKDAAVGNHHSQSKWLAEFLNNSSFGFVPMMKKAGFMNDVKPGDVDRFFNAMSTYFGGTAMSARPALVIRNAFQTLLGGAKVGYGNTMRGVVRASKEGAEKRALEAGAIGQDLTGVFLMEEMKGASEGMLRRMHRAGLTWYRKIDRRNRLNSFYSGVEAIEREAPRFMTGKGSWEDFLVRTGLAGDSDFIQKQVLRRLRNEGIDKAADFYGKFLTEETQFLYNKMAAPRIFASTYGRIVGQFGIWPLQYWEYVSRNMGFGAQGHGVANGARNMYRMQFATRLLGQLAVINGMGIALGINTSTFNFGTPFDYEGGPFVQMARDAIGSFTGSSYEKEAARANLQRALLNFSVPFRSALYDWYEASQESDPYMALMLALGFNPRERRRSK